MFSPLKYTITKYRYISAIIVSVTLGTLIWLCVPARFCAQATLVDEYKEMDLLIGINELRIYQRGVQEVYPSGINSIEVYGKVLGSTDYAYAISKVVLPDGKTYSEHINANDTVEDVLENVRYATKARQNTLKIEFSDKDPDVAYTMLDATICYLRGGLTQRTLEKHNFLLENESKKLIQYQEELIYSNTALANYADSHINIKQQSVQDSLNILKKNVTLSRERLKKAETEFERAQKLLAKEVRHFHILKHNTVPVKNSISIWGYILSSLIIGLLFTKAVDLAVKRRNEGGIHWKLHNIFSPWNITILHWAAIVILIIFWGDLLYPLTDRFWISILLWVPTLAIASYVTFHLTYKPGTTSQRPTVGKHVFTPNVNTRWFYLLLAISLILTPLCIKKTMEIVSQFSGENMMNNIRILVTEGEVDWGFLAYCFVINKALFICAIWARKRLGTTITLISVILMFMNAFALMNKSSLLFIFVIIAFALYEKKIISLKSIFLTGGGMMILFFVLTLLRNFTDGDGEIQSDELSFIDFFAMYVLSPPVAYSYMPPDIGLKFGSRSLSLLYMIIGKLTNNFHVESLIQDFMEVPIPTNLYTIMQPFYLDFGQWGVFIFALIYGTGSGWCYALYKNGNSWGCAMYTFLLYNLITQYASENIILTPVISIQLFVLLYLITQTKFQISLFSHKHVNTSVNSNSCDSCL